MNWFKKSYFFIFLLTFSYVISSSFGLVRDVATEMVAASDYAADETAALSETKVIPGGNIIGIKLYTDGVYVVDLASFENERGEIVCPAKDSGIQPGDKVVSLQGEKISSTDHLTECVNKMQEAKINVGINREGHYFETVVTSEKNGEKGTKKLGMWVRDSAAGIGTVTFINPENNSFFALGHAISDKDIGKKYSVKTGSIEFADVKSVVKSEEGSPGEIRATFGKSGNSIGTLKGNCDCGIYGSYSGQIMREPVSVASRWQIKEGNATILCSLDGNSPKEYDIKITKLMLGGGFSEKSMVIEITDPELIKQTGGIVQGMSGSPILQNGKLVGAVTHVFIKNPLRGYGIFIENMLAEAERIK